MSNQVYEFGSPGTLDRDDVLTTTNPDYPVRIALADPDVESVIVNITNHGPLEYRKQKPKPEAYVVHFAVVIEEDNPEWADVVARTYLTNQFSSDYHERVELASNSRVEKL